MSNQGLYPETHQTWSFLESLELPSTLQVCIILSTWCLIGKYFGKTGFTNSQLASGQAPCLDEAWSFRKLWGYQLCGIPEDTVTRWRTKHVAITKTSQTNGNCANFFSDSYAWREYDTTDSRLALSILKTIFNLIILKDRYIAGKFFFKFFLRETFPGEEKLNILWP